MLRPVEIGAGVGVAAAVLAHKFAIDWRKRVMRSLIDGSKNPARDASLALHSRLDTVAITETAKSYNSKRDEIARRVRVSNDKLLVKRWDALLDACDYCAREGGQVVLASEHFSGGTPGLVHPRCRCIAQYMLVSRFEFYAMRA